MTERKRPDDDSGQQEPTERPPSRDNEIEEDPLVESLVADASAPPDVGCLPGLLGKSSREGYVRLYMDLTFSEFVEIPRSDIVHTESLPKAESRITAQTIVWIRDGARLIHTRHTTLDFRKEFLAGPIAQRFLPRTPVPGFTWAGFPIEARRSRTFLWFCVGCCDITSTYVSFAGICDRPQFCDPSFEGGGCGESLIC
jgi:hypothetical protein